MYEGEWQHPVATTLGSVVERMCEGEWQHPVATRPWFCNWKRSSGTKQKAGDPRGRLLSLLMFWNGLRTLLFELTFNQKLGQLGDNLPGYFLHYFLG